MTQQPPQILTVVMADDDPLEHKLVQRAWTKARICNPLFFVNDGQELMEYLRGTGRYVSQPPPKPGLILLDLNMPVMDGREVIEAIHADDDLNTIPLIVLTGSEVEQDILKSYELGVNSFITKPITFENLVLVLHDLSRYWFELVRLPT
ncbi:MAG: response regulator [Myxococcota bacterium]